MAFTRINSRVLHWSAAGRHEGPVVVFINSLGSDFRIWAGVVEQLAPHYRIVLYDKTGHGLSDVSSDCTTIDAHVDDLMGLLDALKIDQCAVVGLSVGGMIAQRFAVRKPARVKTLVLCDTAAKIGTHESWTSRIEAVQTSGLASIADAVLERWFTAEFCSMRPAELSGWRNMLVRTPAEGYIATCKALRDADLRSDACRISAPTLCLVGDEDGATPPDLVRGTAALIPNARFEVIAGAGHLPCIEKPVQLGNLIVEHLKETGHV